MTALAWILVALTSLVGLVWASRHVLIAIERRKGFVLTEDYAGGEDLPAVTVVVAAKDEQDNIGPCVSTMLDQDYPRLEMIAVNDRSSDNTAAIVERLAAADRRLRLVNVGDLPTGWCGKNHAMHVGLAEAGGEWICMIDADCRQTSRRSLRSAVAYALDARADLLSVLPNLEMKGFWENAVQPVCGGVLMIWFAPGRVNDPHHATAYANGAFMLIRRSAYDAIGGHEAVKDRVNEDMHMAARVKQAGLRLCVVRNQGLYLVRMYTSLGAIVRGWSRIFYGTFGTLGRLSLSVGLLTAMGLLPYATAALGLAALAAGAAPAGVTLALAGVGTGAVAMQLSVIYRFYRLIGARAAMAWTYPLGCAVALAALVAAVTKLRHGAHITWRNTTYTHQA